MLRQRLTAYPHPAPVTLPGSPAVGSRILLNRRVSVLLGVTLAALALPQLCAAQAGDARVTDGLNTAPVGRPPLSDSAAGARVHRSSWEPRPQNAAANRRVPTSTQVALFRRQSQNDPYKRYVDGHYRGTTDEVIQWAAAKWGLDPNLLRAVAAVETWWYMSFVGNEGTAFGLFQVSRPWHCLEPVVCKLFRKDTAFNATTTPRSSVPTSTASRRGFARSPVTARRIERATSGARSALGHRAAGATETRSIT